MRLVPQTVSLTSIKAQKQETILTLLLGFRSQWHYRNSYIVPPYVIANLDKTVIKKTYESSKEIEKKKQARPVCGIL